MAPQVGSLFAPVIALIMGGKSLAFLSVADLVVGCVSIRRCRNVHAHASVHLVRRVEGRCTNQVGEITVTVGR